MTQGKENIIFFLPSLLNVEGLFYSIHLFFLGEDLGRESNKSIFRGSHLEGLDKLSDIVVKGSHFPSKQRNGVSVQGKQTFWKHGVGL